MIAIDSSSMISYLRGDNGVDVESVDTVLKDGLAVLPPVVLSELLSDPKLPAGVAKMLRAIPLMNVDEGYWERVGLNRAKVIKKGLKARLADTMIAQNCIDHSIPLITRDRDFKIFLRTGGLLMV